MATEPRIIGLAPKVKGAIASSLRPSLSDAFLLAMSVMIWT